MSLRVDEVSRWFGDAVVVNAVTMDFGPGVSALVGPNGAGKTTLLSMMAGLQPPSGGRITLDGQPMDDPAVRRRIGVALDAEACYDQLTGAEYVTTLARLHGVAEPVAAAGRALDLVEMGASSGRRIGGYSKGMRQRIRIAGALVHDPQVLICDEPFNGMDPVQRRNLLRLFKSLGAQGRTVIVSSHILDEMEQLADRIEVLVAGRHAASGDLSGIRRALDAVPQRYWIATPHSRRVASLLVEHPSVDAVEVRPDGVAVSIRGLVRFAGVVPDLLSRAELEIAELRAEEADVEFLFRHLVAGGAR